MASPTILTLIRHGQTSANLDKVWHGSTDTPLTELGHEQARRVAAFVTSEHADVRALYSSPLERARHTAQPISQELGVEMSLDADLAEYCLGEWEGRSYRDLHKVENMWERMTGDVDYAPPGGESPRVVADRMRQALRAIHDHHPGERVVVVSHGGALALVLGFLLDGESGVWNRVVDNCSVSELVLEPKPALLSFNSVEHLGEAAARFEV